MASRNRLRKRALKFHRRMERWRVREQAAEHERNPGAVVVVYDRVLGLGEIPENLRGR